MQRQCSRATCHYLGISHCEAIPHRRSQNLSEAWKRVKRNKGASGIDGMTVEDFPAFAREHWPRIATAIREGNYRPAPVRRVFIPKPDGTQRPLGIPTVLDRMIQQAVAQVLNPLFERDFSEHSYGLPAAMPVRASPFMRPTEKRVCRVWRCRVRLAVSSPGLGKAGNGCGSSRQGIYLSIR